MFADVEVNAFGPAHAYVAPIPASVATRFRFAFSQILFVPVIAATGNNLIVTVDDVVETQPFFVTVRS
jgi:hypothetical protein